MFTELINHATEMMARCDKLSSAADLAAMPTADQLTYSELDAWTRQVESAITKAFGPKSSQLQEWVTARERLSTEEHQAANKGKYDAPKACAYRLSVLRGVLTSFKDAMKSVLADNALRKSPVFSGVFYLAAAVILLASLTIIAGSVKFVVLPLVVGGAFAGLTLIGALQLRNDDRLSEESFLKLVDLALRRVLLPLAKKK